MMRQGKQITRGGSPGALLARTRPLQVVRAGRTDFLESWRLQRALAGARRNGNAPDVAILVEHPPTYTTGKGGSRANLLIDDDRLREIGATFHEIDRGGDMTFHGPGQIVVYLVLDLGRFERSVRRYIHLLEETIITTLQAFGIDGARHPERPGVWVDHRKIAAIGVAISRGVAYHGFSINVDPDLQFFDYMIPCGIRDAGITSIARERGSPVSMRAVEDEIVQRLASGFAVEIDESLTWPALWRLVPSNGTTRD